MAESPIDNPIESKPAAPQSANESAQAPPNIPPPETHVPSGIEDHRRPENANHKIRECWKVVVETLTFFAVVWYACVASRQLTEMQKSTTATQCAATAATSAATTADQSLKDSRANFQNEQRPFIGLSGNIEKPGIDKDGNVIWNWRLLNYGKSPALDLRVTKYWSVRGGPFSLGIGSKKDEIGPPEPPGSDALWGTVFFKPMPLEERNALFKTEGGLRIKVIIGYTSLYGGDYETSVCLGNSPNGSIGLCRKDNYIK
jgi:hypothetical protein